MSATAVLREEHRGILSMIGVLGRICDRLDAGVPVPVRHLEGVVDFFRGFVDGCHHAKEEEHLFPALEAAGPSPEGAPPVVLRREHEEGRGHVRKMASAARDLGDGLPEGGRSFAAHGRALSSLLASHIAKEDGILFPAADALLPDEAHGALAAAFERVEEERVGRGRHEAYHAMMEHLERTYGG